MWPVLWTGSAGVNSPGSAVLSQLCIMVYQMLAISAVSIYDLEVEA